MQVFRENPCQRLHHRVDAPLRITAKDGSTCFSENWSLGGLKVSDWTSELPSVGDILALDLHLPFQGFDIAFGVEVSVVRIGKNEGWFAAKFTELPERAADLMRHFIEDLVRGKMASVEDTICRIDIPVTPISTKPDVNPADEVPVRRWPVKTIVMSCFYIIFGLSVFAYAAMLLHSNIMRLEVESAVVSAPLLTVKMPVAGHLDPVAYEKGRVLRQGDLIAKITNPALDAKIEEAKLKVAQAGDALLRLEQKAHIEQERMKLYQLVSETDYNIALARKEARAEALAAADKHFLRMQRLAEKGHIANPRLEEANQRQIEASTRLMEAEQSLQQATAMMSASGRRHYNHKVFVVDLDMVELELSGARSALAVAKARLANLLRMKTNQVITAPADGLVVALFAAPHGIVERNAPLMTIEATHDLSVTAFLNQEEILDIGLSDEASIYLPAYGEFLEGKITSIDRNAAFLKPDANHYQWRDSQDRTAAVSISLKSADDQTTNIRAGVPAVVIFNRRSHSTLTARLTKWFGGGKDRDDGSDI